MKPRVIIRVAQGSLAFGLEADGASGSLQSYVTKAGVSMAANLREAFKTSELLHTDTHRATVLVDSPTLLVPIEEWRSHTDASGDPNEEKQNEQLYLHSFPDTVGSVVMTNILPSLRAVALFAVNKDLRLVITDHYDDVAWTCLMRPVWDEALQRSLAGMRRKLFAHAHDGRLELFSFERDRFLFSNRYVTTRTRDIAFFTLYVWKQLALDQLKDELCLSGGFEERNTLVGLLKQYVSHVQYIPDMNLKTP